jgi:uncharacterized protein (DUF952 family)
MIFHILPLTDWLAAQAAGAYTPPSLAGEGFIHASTREQVLATANNFFTGESGLVLLCLDETKISASIINEGEQLWPHIYGPLNLGAVVRVADFPPGPDGLFRLPEGL